MPNARVTIPGSANGEISATPGLGMVPCPDPSLVRPPRSLSYGATPGRHVREGAYTVVTVATGAPGTTTDLSTLIGSTATLTGTSIVYLEVCALPNALGAIPDGRVRLSAANPVALLSGTTDTFTIQNRAILVDVLEGGIAPTYDATHKNITIESTAGGQFALLVYVL